MTVQGYKNILVRWPFTVFGLLSLVLLVLSARGAIPVDGLWRALIIAPYLIHLLLVMLAVLLFATSEPGHQRLLTIFFVVTLPLRLLPFLFADYLLARFRSRQERRPSGDGVAVP